MKLFIIALGLFLAACSGSSGGSSGGTAVTGFDYSGTYISNRIECYNSSLTTLNTAASLTSGQETITITGNSFSSSINSGSCVVAVTGNIVFTADGFSLSNRRVVSATGGGCTAAFTVSNSPANTVSPSTINTAYSTNQALTNVSNAPYIRNTTTGDAGILSAFTNSASASDYCLMVYVKQ